MTTEVFALHKREHRYNVYSADKTQIRIATLVIDPTSVNEATEVSGTSDV